MQSFLFGPPCEVVIELEGLESRKKLTLTKEDKVEKIPLYIGNETIKGIVKIEASKKKKLEIFHNGIKILLIGQIGK